MSLFNILVNLEANSAKLITGLDQATAKITSFTDGAERAFKRIAEAAGGAAFVEFTKHIIDAGAELERASVRAGVSGQAFSELSYAAKLSGVGTDQLATAMTKMNRALSEASTGAKGPIETLAALGLKFDDLKQLRPEEQFELLAERISRLQSPADKSRAEIELFGRAGAELAPLLEQGAAGIEKMREEARKLGASFSDDLLKKLEEAHQSITRLDTTFGALATTVVAKAAPSLSSFFSGITAFLADDKVGQLQAKLDFLNAGFGKQYAFTGPLGALIGQFAAAKRGAQDLQRELDLQNLALRPDQLQSPDMAKLLGGSAPGYAAVKDPLAGLTGDRVNAQKLYTDKMKALFDQFDRDTETTVEHTVAEFHKQEAELDELRSQALISQEEYDKRIAELLDKYLPGVEVTGKRMKTKIKEETDAMEELGQKAAASIQGAFANFLFDPFHGGLKRMAIDFLSALQKMAADAAAAQIFKALFGGVSGKGGDKEGGLGGILGGFLSSAFGGGGGGGSSSGGGGGGGRSSWLRRLLRPLFL